MRIGSFGIRRACGCPEEINAATRGGGRQGLVQNCGDAAWPVRLAPAGGHMFF